MIRGYVVCEGQTEETFIRDVIAPILSYQKIDLRALLISTSKGNKGGALSYARVKRFILNLIKQENNTFITTFFDLYALDNDFPNFLESKKQTDVYKKVSFLEQAFKDDIIKENTSFASRFYPIFSLMNLKAYYLLILPNSLKLKPLGQQQPII